MALVAFGANNATSRAPLSASPWTDSTAVLRGWLEGLPSLAEGVGRVVAYEAIAEALSMFEQPSQFTPEGAAAAECKAEVLMLWVSEAVPSASVLQQHPARTRVPGQVRLGRARERGARCPVATVGAAAAPAVRRRGARSTVAA